MPYRSVKMPNGRYTVFSTVVDSFVADSMTREEAVAQFALSMSWHDADEKVARADHEPLRWAESLATVRRQHGEDEMQSIVAELGITVLCWKCFDRHQVIVGRGTSSGGASVTVDTRCPDCTSRDGTTKDGYQIQRDLWKMPKDRDGLH